MISGYGTRVQARQGCLLYVIALQSYRTVLHDAFTSPPRPPTIVKVRVPVLYRNLHFRLVPQVGRGELEMVLYRTAINLSDRLTNKIKIPAPQNPQIDSFIYDLPVLFIYFMSIARHYDVPLGSSHVET